MASRSMARSTSSRIASSVGFPAPPQRNALKERKVIVAGRKDTATVEKKIGGIQGKPRYYAIDLRALHLAASGERN
jgi:hypothetical protein